MIRIGLIGAGGNGKGNIKKLASYANRCRIAAVADVDQALAAAAADPYGARVFADFRDFFEEVDAVVISTPNFMHPDQAVACAEAGKHVFIEKPMALTVADADRVVEAVDKAGVGSMIGFSVRFSGSVRAMKQQIDAGVLGGLVSLWSRRMSYSQPGGSGWRTEYEKSGGLISELLAHEIDWIMDIAGEPDVVFCRKAARRHEHPLWNDHIWLTMGFGCEVTGTIEGSCMARVADYYRGVVGEQASVFTSEWGQKTHLQTDRETVRELDLPPDFEKHAHFLDVCEGICKSVADVHSGRRVVRVTERALQSVESGQAVTLEEEGCG